jgi:integrase
MRDSAIVFILAYAGLRPGELRALRWGDVRERTILVQRGADPDGKAKTTKTRAARTVQLLAPLTADLREWRMASGRPGGDALVFSREGGGAWTKDDWDVFRANGWKTACKHAGLVPAPSVRLRARDVRLGLTGARRPRPIPAAAGARLRSSHERRP